MAQDHHTAAVILRDALKASPYSARSLSKTLAARPDVDAQPESIRRSLSKWMRGTEQPSPAWAAILEDQLALRQGALSKPAFSRAVTLAGQLVRRLEAGETLPAETLMAVAEETERAGRQALRFAARLRREAQTPDRRNASRR